MRSVWGMSLVLKISKLHAGARKITLLVTKWSGSICAPRSMKWEMWILPALWPIRFSSTLPCCSRYSLRSCKKRLAPGVSWSGVLGARGSSGARGVGLHAIPEEATDLVRVQRPIHLLHDRADKAMVSTVLEAIDDTAQHFADEEPVSMAWSGRSAHKGIPRPPPDRQVSERRPAVPIWRGDR